MPINTAPDVAPSRDVRLWRTPRDADRRIAGVCGALAQRWQVDPLLIRVAAVLLLLSSGVGAVLYAAGWLLMPARPGTAAPLERALPGASRWSRRQVTWFVVIASVFVVIMVGRYTPGGILPLIIVAAVWFFARRSMQGTRSQATPSAPLRFQQPGAAPGASEFDRAVWAWQQRLQYVTSTQNTDPAPFQQWAPSGPSPVQWDPSGPSPLPWASSGPSPLPWAQFAPQQSWPPAVMPTTSDAMLPRSQRRPAPSWGRGLALLGVAVGVYSLASVALVSSPAVSTRALLLGPASVALAVVAVGLLIGSRIGRPRLAVLAGLVLSLVVVAALTVPANLPRPSAASHQWTTQADLPTAPVPVNGQVLELTLSDLTLSSPATVTLNIKGGAVEITLPKTCAVQITYTMTGGALDFNDEGYVGTASGTWTPSGQRDGPVLTLILNINGGLVAVDET